MKYIKKMPSYLPCLNTIKTIVFVGFCAFLSIFVTATQAETNDQAKHFVEVETLSFARPFWVAVVLPIKDGENIQLNQALWNESTWQLPTGFTIGQVLYPKPDVFLENRQTTGYSQSVSILYEIVPPAAYDTVANLGSLPYAFKHSLTWSECNLFCMNQSHSYSFELNMGDGYVVADNIEVFNHARLDSLPPLPWPVEAYVDIDRYTVSIVARQDDISAHSMFIPTQGLFAGSVATVTSFENGVLTLTGEISPDNSDAVPYFSSLSGMVANFDGTSFDNAYRVFAPNMKEEVITWTPRTKTSESNYSLFIALGLAFLGGLVLNLMPCVFPVLAMKAFQFAQLSFKTPSQMRQDGIAYTMGILTSFLLVAITLIILRGLGGMVGWGFQLQSPIFIMFLVWLMVAVCLNFLGVYSLRFQALQNLGNSNFIIKLFGSSEKAKSFSTGVLATVVATPCTAPFMAPAIGYALTQPPLIGLSIFLMLGLGLAFPYLVLSFVPAFGVMLPKSGPWLGKLQRWLALPLGLTVVWLLWVLSQQINMLGLLSGLASVGFLMLALYSKTKKATLLSVLIGSLLVAYVDTNRVVQQQQVSLPGIVDGLETVVWSPQAVAAYREENRPIFLNVTAAWCITCLVHEKLVFSNDSFQAYMRENNIIYMVADWTNPDARIAKLLEQHSRSGIPFYMFYPQNQMKDAVLLPEVLTPASTIKILEENQ